MNNFVFGGSDPLLYTYGNKLSPDYSSDPDLKRQIDSVMQQYQQLQQAKSNEIQQKDWLGDFDKALKSIDSTVADTLSADAEFTQLNSEVQQDIQNEIMLNIKWKLNGKPETVSKVKRMLEIIDNHNREKVNEDKRNIAEITDYIQNFSDMTFNEYKKLKEITK